MKPKEVLEKWIDCFNKADEMCIRDRYMAGKIQTMIPQYGELNRIYRDYIDNYAFSFERQKFISEFYQENNDMISFEAAILELLLDKQKEQ